jgi:hypothetical protein
MEEANRRAELRKVFYQRYPEDARTGTTVLKFFIYLQAERPHLLPKTKRGADPYQALKSDLHGHFTD